MEDFKNEFCSELIRAGFKPEEAVRALSALSITLHGYTVVKKDSDITIYDSKEVTTRLIKLFIDCKRVENCSPSYCQNLSIVLPKLFEYAGKGPKEITSFDIRGFLASWQINRNVSGATMDKYRQLINVFFLWLQDENYVTRNPCATIKKIKCETRLKTPLNQLELELIRSSLINARERVIVEMLYSTGCRVSELAGVKLSDINLENGTVLLFGKGKKEREGYLNPKAIVAIQDYLAERKHESEYLICSQRAPYGKVHYRTIEAAVSVIGERVKDKVHHHLHPHIFRHTNATTALRSGLDVTKVQKLLGHSNIATTMRYAKVDESQLKNDHATHIV